MPVARGSFNELLAESLILGVAGGVAALILSSWAVSSLTAMLPEAALPRQQEIGSSVVVFAVAACVAMASAVLAGLPPALQLSRVGVTGALRDGGRTATDHGHRTTRRSLLAVEFALATMLLAGAGLMGRSLLALQAIEPGFDPSNVLALTVPVDGLTAGGSAEARAVLRRGRRRPRGRARRRTGGGDQPSAARRRYLAIPREHRRPAGSAAVRTPRGDLACRSSGLFRGDAVARSRPHVYSRDGMHDLPVVIINQSFAAKHFAGEDPVGRRIRVGSETTRG